MTIHDQLRDLLIKHTGEETVPLDHPDQPEHGDYASPVAMALAKKQGRAPMDIAGELKKEIENDPLSKEFFARVEVAPPGYLNFFLSRDVFAKQLTSILEKPDEWGRNNTLAGKKVMVEYTDPNPFKEFHIGHLMSNAIGEAISRIIEFSGAEVKRVNYYGDVGMHVAKAIWGMERILNESFESVKEYDLQKRVGFLGRAYAYGANAFEENENVRREIKEFNKKIFERSDKHINELYDEGKQWSLDCFEVIYKRLGTKFDYDFPESAVWRKGSELVAEGLAKGVFEKSDGAVVFRGEMYGLHTRVFINSEGLPTYEAKELGLAVKKHEAYPHDTTIIITANEIVEYFKVVLAALNKLYPDLAAKIFHVPHGFLRLASGKMASRKGNVVTGDGLVDKAKEMITKKVNASESVPENQKDVVTEQIAVGAVKYSILRQSSGKDIIFDFNTSLSFEGDSGPYLQYTHARARSVLEKAGRKGDATSRSKIISGESVEIERLLLWFPEMVVKALDARDPHYIATYLSDLAQAFNSFYAKERILGADDDSYKLALTAAVAATLKNGLWLLGIQAPERM